MEGVADPYVTFADRHSPTCWIYTGSFENDPERVDRIASRHQLWGNPGRTLLLVRNPFALARCLERSGLLAPEVRPTSDGLPRDGSWLAKPLASAGGLGVVRLTQDYDPEGEPVYYQERIQGRSHSALFLADPPTSCSLIGVSRQFHGAGSQPFAYRGSLGPLSVDRPLLDQLIRIGRTVTADFGLVGLFGVDFLLNRAGIWVVEANPRYTASVEIHELANGCAVLPEHRRVCESESPKRGGPAFDGRGSLRKVVGKWIVYATRRLTVPDLPISTFDVDHPFAVPEIADVPEPGTVVDPGEPVLTVFGEGEQQDRCMAALRANVNRWRTLLGLAD